MPSAHTEPNALPVGDATLDAGEVARFKRLAGEWWDPNGKFRPLHQQGPARLGFIRGALVRHFGLPERDLKPLKGLSILDIGCGGGLISEPLCRLGARVTGIDPTAETIAVAQAHAAAQGLAIDYRAQRAEALIDKAERFDAVVCLEVLEHVPDVGTFLKLAAGLVRPGGLIVLSTLNRTFKAYALAIVAAEYVLGWLPRGTHDWQRFVAPEELKSHLAAAGFETPRFSGLVYDVMRDEWRLDAADLDVNYMAAAARGA
jgi:2-polyprenyl-6-hydroxyphenyl methylase/3-demethylubiquinone-9 3-methyltransferase